MHRKIYTLLVTVGGGPGTDEKDLDELAHLLSDELFELDNIESIEIATSSQPPVGAKGSPIELGTILIKVAEAGGFVALVSFFSNWLARDRRRSLKLSIGDDSIELTGLSKAEQQELTRWFQIQTGLRLDR